MSYTNEQTDLALLIHYSKYGFVNQDEVVNNIKYVVNPPFVISDDLTEALVNKIKEFCTTNNIQVKDLWERYEKTK